jgi:hypothetical protein
MVVAPGGAAGVFKGRLVVVFGSGTGSGIFIYSGTPGAGNPPVLWAVAPGVTQDPFGNTVAAVLGAGNPSGANTQIDATGDITLTGTGNSQLQLQPAANLPFSLTTSLTGIMESLGLFGSGDSNQTQAGVISGITLGTSTAAKMGTLITSPYGGSGSGMGLLLEATNDGGTDTPFGTFGTVSTQGGTLTFQPVVAMLPYAVLFYESTGALTVVTKTTGSGTIPIPVGVSTVLGECWGAAAGGPNSEGSNAASGGEYAAEPALAVTGGGTVSYVVASGGAGAPANGSPTQGSAASGNTTLTGNAVTVTAHPGLPGTVAGSPAAGGTGSTNTTHHDGGAAGQGSTQSGGAGGGASAGPSAVGGTGGAVTGDHGASGGTAPSGGGNGGKGGNGTPLTQTAGSNGSAPGGGGGGGGGGSSSKTGGTGANGQVRVTYASGAPALLASFAAASGTDQFGTAYPAGVLFAKGIFAQDPAGSSGTAESWHTVSLDAGWSGTLRYKLLAQQNVVYMQGAITHTAFSASTNIASGGNALPSSYRPAATVNVGGTGIPTRAGLEVTSAGVVIAIPNGTSCTECDSAGLYPLD